jgi:hypothetical protein
MSKETKKTAMKKVAVKTVIANCRADLKEVKEVRALLATLFKKAETEWIPKVAKVEKESKDLLRKAIDISVTDENGTMDVAVSSDEGEAVTVTDNTMGGEPTDAPEADAFATEGSEPEAPMNDDEMQKTFKLIQENMAKLSKSIEKKKTK